MNKDVEKKQRSLLLKQKQKERYRSIKNKEERCLDPAPVKLKGHTHNQYASINITVALYRRLLSLMPSTQTEVEVELIRVLVFLYNYYALTSSIYIKDIRTRIKQRAHEAPDFTFFIELKKLYKDLEVLLKQTKYL